MKQVKKHFIPHYLFLVFISLIITLSLSQCRKKKEVVIAEKSIVFTNNKWNRFNYIEEKFEINDTISRHQIVMDIHYLPYLSCKEIPLIFTIISPDSSISHIRHTLNFSQSVASPFSIVIHPAKYFNHKGIYSLKFFQKTSQYDIEGVEKLDLKIIRVPEQEK